MFSEIYAITVNSPNLIPNYMFKFRSNSGQKCSPEPEPEPEKNAIPVDLWVAYLISKLINEDK